MRRYLRRRRVSRDVATGRKSLAIVGAKLAERSAAQPHRLFQHRVEHRRQIAGRGVDHLQHLGGRGLLLQRLALLGQQPRVLDRDHRLIGEGADEFDLPVGERLDPLAREHDDPDRLALAQQRHAKRGPLLAEPDRVVRIARNGGHVVNMHGAALRDGSRSRRFAVPVQRQWLRALSRRPRIPVESRNSPRVEPECRHLAAVDHGLIGIAKPRGGLDHRVQAPVADRRSSG